ncbi:MAG: hypothetical protein ACK5Z5_09880 [Neisseriaceae bacterium]
MQKILNKVYVACFLLICKVTIAADSFGIAELDKGKSTFNTAIKVICKYGGLTSIVILGIMYAFRFIKEIGTLFWVLLGVSIIAAGYGWWDSFFTSGFSF